MLPDQEIDVLKATNEAKLLMDHLPSVDELPVLPHLRQSMDVDLAVNADGRVYLFYDGQIAEDTDYALYSIDDSSLTLVSSTGRIQDIGMTVHKPMRKYMRTGESIFVIEMNNGTPGKIVNIPMIIHEIGF
ncbi:MAG TPA: hypothetical protein DCM27_05825 [Rhodospirillaceae bacterium]|nr:hypothetical protein [Rhodospirillaceae bacterium]